MSKLFRRLKEAASTENVTNIGNGINLDRPTKFGPINLPFSARKRGMMVVGTTGVGKTRLAEHIIAQDIAMGYNVVLIDPKSDQEILSKIYDVAKRHDRRHELQLITPIYPELSALIDPMAYYFMVDELVDHITAAIPPSREPFYKSVAKELSTAIITASLIIAEQEGKLPNLNFDQIREKIRRDSLESMKGALEKINTREAQRTAGIISDILHSSQEHFTKVSMSMRTALMDLSSGNIGAIIGQADSNRFISRLEEGKRIIMVIHTGAMMINDGSQTLGRVLVSMIQKHIGRVYSSSKKIMDPPLAIHIDEAQKVLYDGIESLPSMAGSANVMTTFYVQDVAQLSAVLGEEFGRIILNNCNTKIFLRCPDAETSEYVTKHFGTHNVLTGIYSSNQVTTREVEQDVIKPYDVLNMQVQEFLMLSYTGRWKGTTANVQKPECEIVFPEAPTLASLQPREGHETIGA